MQSELPEWTEEQFDAASPEEQARYLWHIVFHAPAYEAAIALGEPRWQRLNVSAKEAMMIALLATADVPLRNKDWATALRLSERAIALGRPVFHELDGQGRRNVLTAMVNAGLACTKLNSDFTGKIQSLERCNEAALLGESTFESLDTEGRLVLLYAWTYVCVDRFNLGMPFEGSLGLTLLLARRTWAWEASDLILKLVENRNEDDPIRAATRWLSRDGWPILVRAKLAHWNTVMGAARACLAAHPRLPWRDSGMSVVRKLDLPSSFRGPGHLLLALLVLNLPALLPSDPFGASIWAPDLRAIARALRLDSMVQGDGRFRTMDEWSTLLPRVSTTVQVSRLSPDDFRQLKECVRAYKAGDIRPFARVLMCAWSDLVVGSSAPVKRLTEWLAMQVTAASSASSWVRARDAVLLLDCRYAIHETWFGSKASADCARPWRTWTNFAVSELATLGRQLRDGDRAVLRSLWLASSELLALTVREPIQDPAEPSEALRTELAWDALACLRVGLASPIKSLPVVIGLERMPWKDPDARARVSAMEKKLAVEVCERDRDPPGTVTALKTVDDDESANGLEPFTTYVREWRRAGIDLRFPKPDLIAATLKPGQAFVQVFGVPGEAALHALVLSALGDGPEQPGVGAWDLRLLRAPQALNDPALVLQMQDQQALEQEADAVAYFRAWSAHWQALTQPNGPAASFLNWLDGLGRAGVIALLPHEWSALPWQALWAQCRPESPMLKLTASADSWFESCQNSQDARHSAPSASVLISLDLMKVAGAFEGAELSRALNVDPVRSNDLADAASALEAPGATHLAMHGEFSAEDPLSSALVVDKVSAEDVRGDGPRMTWPRALRGDWSQRKGSSRERPDPVATGRQTDAAKEPGLPYAEARLPASLLLDLKIKGDVSLAACESLAQGVGTGEARHLGPMGLGPVLAAAGARSVVGSLWPCDDWATAVFYACWYGERRAASASEALKRASKRLRDLAEGDFLAWVARVAPHSLGQARARCELARKASWPTPFGHPWCWTGFALLCDAPPLAWIGEVRGPCPRSWWQRLLDAVLVPLRMLLMGRGGR